jgi:thiol-disulfide isomerase/thioredoxin
MANRYLVAFTALIASPSLAGSCPQQAGNHMPVLNGVDANNHPATSAVSKGWTFVTVGASWCKPCAKELPAWDALAKKYAAKATYIAVDIDEKVAAGVQFHKSLGLASLTGLYVDPNKIGNLGDTMPTTYLVDDKGIIRYVECGFNGSGSVQAMDAELAKIP